MKKVQLGLLAVVALFVSVAANAATYEGETVTKVFGRVGKDLNGAARLSTTLDARIYRVSTKMQWVDEWVFECEDDLFSDGSRGDWKGFFSARRADKPARLAAAIQGVGLSTAEMLVEDGYFRHKPRSWREFVRSIEDADDTYQTGFSYEVLVTYKKNNLINLGYLVEGQCGYVIKKRLRRVPVKVFHRSESRSYEIRINNAPLLTAEKESFTVSFDGFDDSIHFRSAYNDYQVDRWTTNDKVVFELTGSRKLVRPDNTLSATASSSTGKLQVRVSDAAFDKDVLRGTTRTIVGKVYVDRSGWKSNKHIADFAQPLNNDSATTLIEDLGVQVPQERILIVYSIQHQGSRYYSSEPSFTKKLRLNLK